MALRPRIPRSMGFLRADGLQDATRYLWNSGRLLAAALDEDVDEIPFGGGNVVAIAENADFVAD